MDRIELPDVGNLAPHTDLLHGALRKARERHAHVADKPTDRFADYIGRPDDFAREVLGQARWAAQRTIGQELETTRRVTVRSCRGTGKTRELAFELVYWLNTRECIIVTMAPSDRQVRELLWSEVRDLYDKARIPLLGRPDQTQLKIGPRHFAVGFSTDRPERAQGYHGGRVPPPDDPDRDLTADELEERLKEIKAGSSKWGVPLIWMLDECVGIDQKILDVIQGSLVGPNVYVLMAANPLQDAAADHWFAKSHKAGSGFARIKIAAEPAPEDLPDTTSSDYAYEHVPNWLLTQEAIDERKRDWGEDSPLWRAHGLAQFAVDEGDAQVVPSVLIELASDREAPDVDLGPMVGVDVARTRDACVATLWHDGTLVGIKRWRPKLGDPAALMSVAQTIGGLLRSWGRQLERAGVWEGKIPGERCSVDKVGLGEGVCDRLGEMGIFVQRVDFGSPPVGDWRELTGEVEFDNRKAELFWVMRRALQEGMGRIPERDEFSRVWEELPWITYDEVWKGGRTVIKLEKKEKVRERHGRSPDYADAAVLAWSRAGIGMFDVGASDDPSELMG